MFIAFLLASTSKPPTAGAPSTTAPPPQKQQQPQQQSQPQKTPAAASTTAPPPQKQQQQQAGTRQPQAASEGTASSAKAQRPDAAVEKEGGGGSSGFGGLNILSSFTKKDTSSGESGDTAGGKSKTAAQYELESTKLRREIQEREQRVCLGCCVFFFLFFFYSLMAFLDLAAVGGAVGEPEAHVHSAGKHGKAAGVLQGQGQGRPPH